MSNLQHKVKRAICLLKSIPREEGIEVSYSGGKDSEVILRLAQLAGIPFRGIYKLTGIDPPGTTAHVASKGVEIHKPKMSYWQIIEKRGFPTRRARMCCDYMKEYRVLPRAIQGIRWEESAKRRKNYTEPEVCRRYKNSGKVRVYLPILDWTTDDVAEFIAAERIQCHPLYYDADGNFVKDRRLGCMGCPLKSDKGLADFKKYPKLMRLHLKFGQRYFDTHQHTAGWRKFDGDAANAFLHNVFYEDYDTYKAAVTGGIFGSGGINARETLSRIFQIDLSDIPMPKH